MNRPAGLERCRSCVHANDMTTDYDYCHVCVMERDCYKPKDVQNKPDVIEGRQSHTRHMTWRYI